MAKLTLRKCGSGIAKSLKSLCGWLLRKCGSVVVKSLINIAEGLRAEIPHTPYKASAPLRAAKA